MSAIIDREEAIACVNSAEQKIGGISWKIQQILSDVGEMSRHLKGTKDSSVQQMYETINEQLPKWLGDFQSETLLVNKSLETHINTGEDALGPMVSLTVGDRNSVNVSNITDGVVMTGGGYKVNTVGLTSIADAETDFNSFTNHANELSQDLSNIINDYKDLWAVASQHTNVQEGAHEAATTIRKNVTSLEENITSFGKKYLEEAQKFDDKEGTNAADVISKVSSMQSKLDSINFEMPISW